MMNKYSKFGVDTLRGIATVDRHFFPIIDFFIICMQEIHVKPNWKMKKKCLFRFYWHFYHKNTKFGIFSKLTKMTIKLLSEVLLNAYN